MKVFTNILWIIFLMSFANSQNAPRGSYFEASFETYDQLYTNLTLSDWSGLKFRRISRTNTTRALFGDVYLKIPFGNNIMIETTAYKKQGGEFRLLPYRLPPQPYCDYNANDIYYYQDIAANSDFPADIRNNCPLPPGKYSYYGVIFTAKHVPKIILPSGEYAVNMSMYIGNDLILRQRATIRVYRVGY